MSLIVRAVLALGVSSDPMAILDHVPAFAFPLAIALVLVLSRQLRLSATATLLAMLATAFYPMSQAFVRIRAASIITSPSISSCWGLSPAA